MKHDNLLVYSTGSSSTDQIPFEVVERKGMGHPDTICDTIAERLSQLYSNYCLANYGVILRHMVDKIALAGGSSEVSFGGGRMTKPVKVYLNCRLTSRVGDQAIPYLEIATQAVRQHLSDVLPLLSPEYIEIIDNVHFSRGPGVVFDSDGKTLNERQHFFEAPTTSFAHYHDNRLRANDTSTAVAYEPLSELERLVIGIEVLLNSPNCKVNHPDIGSDIKVMAKRFRREVSITLCVPIISSLTASVEAYKEYLDIVREIILSYVSQNFSFDTYKLYLNTRDDYESSDFYLTLTGSALESGDEGVVGRGNRSNGVISFTRQMSMEAACGKNPVYHVGKVYTALARQIARQVYEKTGFENTVTLTSQMGRLLSDPWSIAVATNSINVSSQENNFIEEIVANSLGNIYALTSDIVSGKILLY